MMSGLGVGLLFISPWTIVKDGYGGYAKVDGMLIGLVLVMLSWVHINEKGSQHKCQNPSHPVCSLTPAHVLKSVLAILACSIGLMETVDQINKRIISIPPKKETPA